MYNIRKAFTITELVFVIVIIGILSAIAIPKFTTTANVAYISKGKNMLASVRNALATERQKRILRGDFTEIDDLAAGGGSDIFDKFNADKGGTGTKHEILRYPPKSGSGDGQWSKLGTDYTFHFHQDGSAKTCTFTLSSNKLVVNSSGCTAFGE